MTRRELLQRMTSSEISEWVAYANLEPFGGELDFLGAGIIAATIANVNRPNGQKAYKPSDFMPNFERKKQSKEQMLQIAEMLTVGLGGKDLRHKKDTDGG